MLNELRLAVQKYLSAILGVAFIASTCGWFIEKLNHNETKALLKAETEGRASDRAQYVAAQAVAESEALREKQRIEDENRQRAEEHQRDYDQLLASYRESLGRVRRENSSARSQASRADLPRSSDSTESSVRGAESADVPNTVEYIEISFSDAEICAENTAFRVMMHEWATDPR